MRTLSLPFVKDAFCRNTGQLAALHTDVTARKSTPNIRSLVVESRVFGNLDRTRNNPEMDPAVREVITRLKEILKNTPGLRQLSFELGNGTFQELDWLLGPMEFGEVVATLHKITYLRWCVSPYDGLKKTRQYPVNLCTLHIQAYIGARRPEVQRRPSILFLIRRIASCKLSNLKTLILSDFKDDGKDYVEVTEDDVEYSAEEDGKDHATAHQKSSFPPPLDPLRLNTVQHLVLTNCNVSLRSYSLKQLFPKIRSLYLAKSNAMDMNLDVPSSIHHQFIAMDYDGTNQNLLRGYEPDRMTWSCSNLSGNRNQKNSFPPCNTSALTGITVRFPQVNQNLLHNIWAEDLTQLAWLELESMETDLQQTLYEFVGSQRCHDPMQANEML